MPRISIGDCHLHYERHGVGFPVIFVAGLAGHASFWREQIPAFSKKFDTIAFDQRGVGESDHSRIAYTMERMADDVVKLMDALEIEKAHLVGHSTGGAMAQILAVEHPKRLASMVLAGCWTKADAFSRRCYGLRKNLLKNQGPEAYVESTTLFFYPPFWIAKNNEKARQLEAQALATLSAPEIINSRIDAILAFDRTADLGKIKTPTLVTCAQDDIITPAYFSEELARLIPGAEAKFFPQGGHNFIQVVGRAFNNAVLPFLQAHTPS